MATPTGPLHLAAAVDGVGQYDAAVLHRARRGSPSAARSTSSPSDDTLRPARAGGSTRSPCSPASRPPPRRIGLVPTVTTTHTEPFHVQAAVATLDWVSRGRAGWSVEVSATEAEARLVRPPRPPPPPPNSVARGGRGRRRRAARLWDSWEDDAEIRDAATGRFIDRDKLHYVDFEGAAFPVRGPAIVPRPPAGPPGGRRRRHRPGDLGHRGPPRRCGLRTGDRRGARRGRIRDELRRRAAAYGRDPDALRVLAALAVDLGDGERGRPAPARA